MKLKKKKIEIKKKKNEIKKKEKKKKRTLLFCNNQSMPG